MKKERKGIKVLTWSFAKILGKKGFKQIGIQPNTQKPQYNTYIFEATPECEAYLKYLVEEKKNGMAISPDDECENCGTKENLSLESFKVCSIILCDDCYNEEIEKICDDIEEEDWEEL